MYSGGSTSNLKKHLGVIHKLDLTPVVNSPQTLGSVFDVSSAEAVAEKCEMLKIQSIFEPSCILDTFEHFETVSNF